MQHEVSVNLTAKIKSLKSQLKKAEGELGKFSKTANSSASKVGDTFVKTGKGAANAVPAMTEFSRVIQDAPFGIQGVGNNVQQLTSTFGNLTRKTGGAKAALKLMLGTLSGPAGILLVVSAVTSLMTAFSGKIKLTTDRTRELARATKDYITSAQSEISILKTLVGVAQDESLSKKIRLGAIDRINEKYSKYLGNMNLEVIGTKEVKSSIDALTKSLLKQAQVRGVQALIEKKFADSAEDLVYVQANQKKAAIAVQKEVKRLIGNVAAFNNVSKNLTIIDQIKELENIVKKAGGSGSGQLRILGSLVGEFNKAVDDTKKFKEDLKKEINPIQNLLNSLTIDDLFSDLAEIEGVTVFGEKVKKEVKQIKNDFVNLEDIFGINASTQKTLDSFVPDFSNFNASFNALGDVVEFSLKNTVSRIKPQLSNIEKTMVEFNESASEIITSGTVSAFSSIGEAIGSSLANGGDVFKALGASILDGVGQVAVQLGKAAIKIGIGMLSIKEAFKKPFTAIAAGIALVALGSAISGAARNATSSIGSGSGQTSISGQGDSSSSRSSIKGFSSSSSPGGVNEFVFRIRGRDLIGVINNETEASKRLGATSVLKV